MTERQDREPCANCTRLDHKYKWAADPPEGTQAVTAREYRYLTGHWPSCRERQARRELLPCPFCGGDATTAPASDTDPDLVYAGCMACDVWCDDADAWNRRHPSEEREPEGWVLLNDAQQGRRGMSVIRIATNGPTATVEVDGREVSRQLAGYELRHHAMDRPRLELDIAVADVGVQGDAEVCYLIGGQEFTSADVARLMDSPPDEDALTDIAIRLAAAMGLPDPREAP